MPSTNAESSPSQPERLWRDTPINSADEDEHNRQGYAKHLAGEIQRWLPTGNVVFALYGGWGTGKSSLKNMICESLQTGEGVKPHIVSFNPWQWEGQGILCTALFLEIANALGNIGNPEDAQRRAEKMRQYGAMLSIGSTALKAVGARGSDRVAQR